MYWWPAAGPLDPYAGHLDAVIWRVTLAGDGRPLIRDTIHACGCYHVAFVPPDRAIRVAPPPEGAERPLVLPGPRSDSGRLALTLTRDDHYLRWPRVAPAAEDAERYELVPLAAAHARAVASGVFGRGGVIRGSGRLERLYLWPSGIASPGAMRSQGRHATAFVGMRHFDAPEVLDGLLVPTHSDAGQQANAATRPYDTDASAPLE